MIGFSRGGFWPVEDRVREAVAVALVGEVALELADEQAAVGEDQDAERAGGFDEAGGGDRLAGRRRVTEAEAAHRARILLGVSGSSVVLVGLAVEQARLLVVLLDAPRAAAWPLPLPFAVLVSRWFAAMSSVSIPASASIWWRRSSVPDARLGRLRRGRARGRA